MLNQYASVRLAKLKTPNCVANHAMTVIVAAGKTSRPVRRKDETVRDCNASSTFPCRDNLITFSELTYPSSMKNIATHAGPCDISRNIGRWNNFGVLFSDSEGRTRERSKQRTRCDERTKTADMPRKPSAHLVERITEAFALAADMVCGASNFFSRL